MLKEEIDNFGIPVTEKETKYPKVPGNINSYIRGEGSAIETKDPEIKAYKKAIYPFLKKMFPKGFITVYRAFTWGEEIDWDGNVNPEEYALSYSDSKSFALALAKERRQDTDPNDWVYAIQVELPIDQIYFHYSLDPVGKEHAKEREVIAMAAGAETKIIKEIKPIEETKLDEKANPIIVAQSVIRFLRLWDDHKKKECRELLKNDKEVQNFFFQCKPKSTMTLYRAFHTDKDYYEKFKKRLGIENLKQGQSIELQFDDLTSWAKSIEMAKKFISDEHGEFGVIIESQIMPEQLLVDYDCLPQEVEIENAKDEFDRFFFRGEQEVIALPGKFKVKLIQDEIIESTERCKSGAGILFYAEDTDRYLFAQRSPLVSEPGTWCTWGGKTEPGETPEQTAMREAKEESGYSGPMELAHLYTRKDQDFTFETFVGVVPKEFKPILCWETQGYKWTTLDELPSPLHHGIEEMFESLGETDEVTEVKTKKSDLKFRFDDEDESGGSGFTIIVSKDGKDAGNIFVTIEDLDSDCYAFEPYKDEPFHDEICDYSEVVSIQHLMVEEEFQGQGIATELMKRSAKEIKKRWSGVPVYINASPMDGPEGISLDALVSFYQKFGFKVLKRYPEHSNALLWKESITHVEAKDDWKNLGITLSHQEGKTKFAEIPTLSVTATLLNGDVAGHVEFEQVGGDWEPQNVNVLGQLQRKGIASAMYDYATQVSGMKVIPSQSQTSYGKALWKDRMVSEASEIDYDDLLTIQSYVDEEIEAEELQSFDIPESYKKIPNKTAYRAISIPSKKFKIEDLILDDDIQAWTFTLSVAQEFSELQGDEKHKYAVVLSVKPSKDQVVIYLPNVISALKEQDEDGFYDVIHTISSEDEVVLEGVKASQVEVVSIYNRKTGKEIKESDDPKYDKSVKGAFDFLTKQKAYIPEASVDIVTFKEPLYRGVNLKPNYPSKKRVPFDSNRLNKVNGFYGYGVYFTLSPDEARIWGDHISEYEPIQPLKLFKEPKTSNGINIKRKDYLESLPKEYNGIIFGDGAEGGSQVLLREPSLVKLMNKIEEQSSDVERAMKLINGAVSKIQYVANISNVKINTDLDQLKKKAFFIITHPECAQAGNCLDHVVEQVNNAFSDKFKEILVELTKYLATLKGVPTQEVMKLLATIEAEDKKNKTQEVCDMDPPWDGIDEGRQYSSDEVIQYLDSIASADDYLDNQYYDIGQFDRWKKKKIPLSELDFSEANVSEPNSQKLVKSYQKLKTPLPAIIAIPSETSDLYRIIDGFHRLAVAKARGDSEIEAYIPA